MSNYQFYTNLIILVKLGKYGLISDFSKTIKFRAAEAPSKPPLGRNADVTFDIYKKKEEQLGMGNKVVRGDVKTLKVDNKE